VEPSVVRDYGFTRDDSEIVVTLASLTHCIGMSIHRHGHEDFSLFLADRSCVSSWRDLRRARA